ncbi:hypothetical protein ACFO5R_09890 [Halosolutus amylolyticus]|uniref:Glycosyltransferase RgtA/B/C/D-like domain-containing protein n=1 Tax=Halosolutus amylolyticus TaxID=2932267 RepID=A0ABD5PP91_9EURY|nr:hypothetical protein [Halosolutus amylolyticus]
MNDTASLKALLSATLLLWAGGIALSWTAGSVFPYLPATLAICSLLFLLFVTTADTVDGLSAPLVAVLSLNSTVYTTMIFVFPEYFIGVDPNTYADSAAIAASTGDLSSVQIPFYDVASGYIGFVVVVNAITDLGVRYSFSVFPLVISIGYPILAYQFLRIRFDSTKFVLLSALIASVVAQALMFAFWPIAQTLAAVQLLFFMCCLVRFLQYRNGKFTLLTLLAVLSLLVTHKLPPLVLLIFFVVLLGFFLLATDTVYANSVRLTTLQDNPVVLMIGIVSLSTAVLWVFYTSFLSNVVYRLLALVAMSGPADDPTSVTTATNTLSRPWQLLLFRGNTITLILMSSVSWLYLVGIRQWRSSVLLSTLLSATASTGLFVVLSVLAPDAITISRSMFLYEIFAVLCIFAALISYTDGRVTGSVPAIVVVVVLILSQVGVAVAVPDASYAARDYLVEEEIEAEKFTAEYATGVTHTDHFYAQEQIYFAPDRDRVEYESITDDVLEGNVADGNYDRVSLREGADVIRTGGHGDMRVDWSELSAVENEYSKTYSNGGVTVYSNSSV